MAIVVVSLLAGCGAPRQRMAYNDLIRMKIDCSNKDAQIRFLQTQMSTPGERSFLAFNSSGLLGIIGQKINGTYDNNQRIYHREYDSSAKGMIWGIRTQCG